MLELAGQLLVSSLIAGSIYAVLGVSWGLIFSTTKVFHFAHGVVYTFGAYVIVLLTMSAGVPLGLSFIAAIAVTPLLGCAMERGIYRPIRERGGSELVIFLAAMGMFVAGESLIQIAWGADARSLSGFPDIPISIGTVGFTTVQVATVVFSWLAILATWLFLARTKWGKAIRAVADNPEMAETIGIDHNMIFLLVFAIGSALSTVAALFYTLDNAATPTMGMEPLLMGFIASFLGGVGSVPGAALAALILGLAGNMGMLVIAARWKVVIAFVILLIVIVAKPEGLLGAKAD